MNPTYVVRATVRDDLCPAFESFMRDRHIGEVMATGVFAGAKLYLSAPGEYLIAYEAISRHSLAEYFEKYAPSLRSESAKAFPEGVTFERDEWATLDSWTVTRPP